jgi:hypothetical protein
MAQVCMCAPSAEQLRIATVLIGLSTRHGA